MRKILAHNTSDKRLISKIHKALTKLNIKILTPTHPSLQWGEEMNRHFYKDLQRVSRHMKVFIGQQREDLTLVRMVRTHP